MSESDIDSERERLCSVVVNRHGSTAVVRMPDGTNLLHRIPVTSIELALDQERADLVLHVERPELSADQVRWIVPESELRWLAEAHGFDLVPRGASATS